MNIEKMREEFEAWLLEVHGLDSEWQEKRNCFADFPAHLAFQAWQASRAALVIELPKRYESDYGAGYYEDDNGDLYQVTDIAKAIEAAGVKWK